MDNDIIFKSDMLYIAKEKKWDFITWCPGYDPVGNRATVIDLIKDEGKKQQIMFVPSSFNAKISAYLLADLYVEISKSGELPAIETWSMGSAIGIMKDAAAGLTDENPAVLKAITIPVIK